MSQIFQFKSGHFNGEWPLPFLQDPRFKGEQQ